MIYQRRTAVTDIVLTLHRYTLSWSAGTTGVEVHSDRARRSSQTSRRTLMTNKGGPRLEAARTTVKLDQCGPDTQTKPAQKRIQSGCIHVLRYVHPFSNVVGDALRFSIFPAAVALSTSLSFSPQLSVDVTVSFTPLTEYLMTTTIFSRRSSPLDIDTGSSWNVRLVHLQRLKFTSHHSTSLLMLKTHCFYSISGTQKNQHSCTTLARNSRRLSP